MPDALFCYSNKTDVPHPGASTLFSAPRSKQHYIYINIFTKVLKPCLIEHYVNNWLIQINK